MTALLIENIAPLMFVALVVVLLLGYPVAFALAAVGIGFALLGIQLGLLGPQLIQALPERMWGPEVGIVATATCAWPDITSSSAGAPPL